MLHDFWGQVFVYIAEVSEGVNLAHNLYLVFFVDMGILGLAAVLMLPLIYFRIGIKTIKKYKNASVEKYYFIVALFAAGTSIIFRNIFNSIGLLYIGGIHTDLPFWLIFISLIYFYRSPVLINTGVKTQ
jgi:O-antigen ligase